VKDLLHKGLSYYGLEEITGEQHNPEILDFFKEIGYTWVQTDETAWCSAFINYLCKVTGYERSGELTARSWLKIGDRLIDPSLGCIVVLWRESPDSWKGHVGLYVNHDNEYIYILGGNQDNSVCVKRYRKDRLLEYRRLNYTKYS